MSRENLSVSLTKSSTATDGRHPCHLAQRHGSHGNGIACNKKLHSLATPRHHTNTRDRGKGSSRRRPGFFRLNHNNIDILASHTYAS
jgi:hypothetical protein